MDFRLDALLEEIRGLRADLAAVKAEPELELEPGVMAIKEGIAPVVATPIPDNFPGRFALKDSGIDYLEDIPRDGDELVKIPGIGKVTANQILTWLSA
jgi:hypothetical protein